MKVLYPASSVQINYLWPLQKWRILDLKNLMRESNYKSTYRGFCKVLTRLEKKKMVCSFREPFSGRKYLYLTKEGDQYLGGGDSPPAIIKENLVHDSKVVELVLEFLKLRSFYGFELEHELRDHKQFKTSYKICPDAILFGEKKREKFKLALELELTRKTKVKYLTKIGQYLESSYYDFILYFFSNRGVMNSYMKHIREKYGQKSNDKIVYVFNEKLLTNKFIFLDSYQLRKIIVGLSL